MELEKLAQQNMQTRFVDNPCRGIVLGLNQDGKAIQLAWIMGRSENSQNRVYVLDNSTLRTEAADPSRVKDPSLIIYNVMRSGPEKTHIVGNGDQNDSVYDGITSLGCYSSPAQAFYGALGTRFCEPDAPTFTPRITGYQLAYEPQSATMSILKACSAAKERWKEFMAHASITVEEFRREGVSEEQAVAAYDMEVSLQSRLGRLAFPTQRMFFEMPLIRGYGYCLTTYKPGSTELNSFGGEPFVVPLAGELEEVMQTFWDVLEPQWKVALAGKIFKDKEVRFAEPINKYKQVV